MPHSAFASIIGNEPIKSYLTRMVDKGDVVQSLLFVGDDGVGKGLFAEALASLLLNENNKADLRIYRPEGKTGMHPMESMRQLCTEVAMPPYEAERKVFIIHDADRMMSYSANALLKTFEEPAAHSVIILLTTSPESLLPTVRSRCCTIRFQRLANEEIAQYLQKHCGKSAEEADHLAVRAQGSIGRALRLMMHRGDPVQEALLQMLQQGRFTNYTQLVKSVEELTNLIEDSMKEVEGEARESLSKLYPEELTKIQQDELEKEVEGIVAMRLNREANSLLDHLLYWHRDMHLLQVKGDSAYLFHADSLEGLQQALRRGDKVSLEQMQKAIAQTRLALARNTSLRNCLEALFLQVHF